MGSFNDLCDKPYMCACGKCHVCKIHKIWLGAGALRQIAEATASYASILLVADDNTYAVCGAKTEAILRSAGRQVKTLLFHGTGFLIPDNQAVERLLKAAAPPVDLLVGVGSGVINDLCKHVSNCLHIPYIIVATAPSMDGYVSMGAALLLDGLKVTTDAKPPLAVVADTTILKDAPMEMIRAGFGDIVGKYSALNDWKLSHLLLKEPFCRQVYDMVKGAVDRGVRLADGLMARREESVEALMESLLLVGVAMSFVGNSHPASGSEHHLSHFFELTGLERNRPYLLHGLDVGYATIITSRLRERVMAGRPLPEEKPPDRKAWEKEIRDVFGRGADNILRLQESGGTGQSLRPKITRRWEEIRAVLAEAPKAEQIQDILQSVDYDFDAFLRYYGSDWVNEAVRYARYTKTYYTQLCLNLDVDSEPVVF